MGEQFLQFFTQISWAGVAGLFVFYVLKPIFERVFNGGISKRLDELEKNHLHSIEDRLKNLEERVGRIENKFMEMEREVGYLKGRINTQK